MLLVGLLMFLLLVFVDCFGCVCSIVLMVVLWSVVMFGCVLLINYVEMLVVCGFVGFGEVVYGSVGVVLIFSIFLVWLCVMFIGVFMVGGVFGFVFGMVFGGLVGVYFGWCWLFGVMVVFGIVLFVVYCCVVIEWWFVVYCVELCWCEVDVLCDLCGSVWVLMLGLFVLCLVICVYFGSGLYLFVLGVLFVWLLSYLNCYYVMVFDCVVVFVVGFVLFVGVGMVGCGIVIDCVGWVDGLCKWLIVIMYCVFIGVCFVVVFWLLFGLL